MLFHLHDYDLRWGFVMLYAWLAVLHVLLVWVSFRAQTKLLGAVSPTEHFKLKTVYGSVAGTASFVRNLYSHHGLRQWDHHNSEASVVAATLIQSAWRSYRARRLLGAARNERKALEDELGRLRVGLSMVDSLGNTQDGLQTNLLDHLRTAENRIQRRTALCRPNAGRRRTSFGGLLSPPSPSLVPRRMMTAPLPPHHSNGIVVGTARGAASMRHVSTLV
jgi:hypothetical protein